MPDWGQSGRAFNSVSSTQVRGRFQGRDGRFRPRTQNMRIRPGDANPYDLHESIRGFCSRDCRPTEGRALPATLSGESGNRYHTTTLHRSG